MKCGKSVLVNYHSSLYCLNDHEIISFEFFDIFSPHGTVLDWYTTPRLANLFRTLFYGAYVILHIMLK